MKYKQVIMAEKRNAAEDILKALDLKNVTREGRSKFIHGINEDGDEIIIVWSNGHCLELQDPDDIDEKYKKWEITDLPIPLNNDKELKIKKEKKELFADIQKELKKTDNIVNAGDAGREGELIQRWILKKALTGKDIVPKRLWTQSLTKEAIRKAYTEDLLSNLRIDEINRLDALYDSGRARAIMDKYLGYNYSRLISLTQTDGVTVNYGRCKSPLVHAIVERDKEIENFVSVPFSYLELTLEKDGIKFKGYLIDEKGDRKDFETENKKELEKIVKSLKKTITVSNVTTKAKFSTPPQPYDTLTLQKEMANKYGYEADKTLAIMEKLYDTYHILTYPRTDTRYYTKEIKEQLNNTLKQLEFGDFAPFVEQAKKRFILDKYFNEAKIADHHAIAPIGEGNLEKKYNSLTTEEKHVFDAVVKNFIALYLPNYEYETTEVLLKEGDNTYKVKGTKDKNLGYKALYPKKKNTKETDDNKETEQALPNLEKGEEINIIKKNIKDSKTKPKQHFTTSSLLDYMQLHNIGTGATRDSIIKELTTIKGYNKESSVVKDGKYYKSTQLGRNMDSVIPEEIKSIDYLKDLEQKIQSIADGKLTLSQFINDMESDFNIMKDKMIKSQRKTLTSDKPNREIVPDMKCPVCGNNLVKTNWGFSCSNWQRNGSGCNFTLGTTAFNKRLTDKVIKELLNNKITKTKFKGLKGQSGKPFDARLELIIDENQKGKIKPNFEK